MKYRILDTCPWPTRRGLTATIVEPDDQEAQIYPWKGKGATEAVVWIDDDPYQSTYPNDQRRWSCVLDSRHLEPIE